MLEPIAVQDLLHGFPLRQCPLPGLAYLQVHDQQAAGHVQAGGQPVCCIAHILRCSDDQLPGVARKVQEQQVSRIESWQQVCIVCSTVCAASWRS